MTCIDIRNRLNHASPLPRWMVRYVSFVDNTEDGSKLYSLFDNSRRIRAIVKVKDDEIIEFIE